MIASSSPENLPDSQRVVITGIGLTAPNGNDLTSFRESLLAGRSGVRSYEVALLRQDVGGDLRIRGPAIPDAQGRSPWDAGRVGRNLQQSRGGE